MQLNTKQPVSDSSLPPSHDARQLLRYPESFRERWRYLMRSTSTDRECSAEAIENIYVFGIGSIYLMSALYICTWLGWLVDLSPGLTSFLTAIVMAAYLINILDCSVIVKYGWGLAAPCIFLLAAGAVSCYVWDVSTDGLAYHQAAVMYQLAGWNPLKSNVPDSMVSLWINSYPRASWLVGAGLSSLFASIEAMKAQNLIFLFVSGVLAFCAIRRLLPELDFKKALLIAVVVSLNPVVVCQILTSYLDGLLASQITCLVALAFLSFSKQGVSAIYGLLFLIPYTLNLKFTALPYLAVLWIALLVLLIWLRRGDAVRFLAVPALIACLIGVCLLGFRPYVINLVEHGHPFYPLMGMNKVSDIEINLPTGLVDTGFGYRLLSGIFAIPDSSGTVP